MKVSTSARSAVDEYLDHKAEVDDEEARIASDIAAQVAATERHDWEQEREDWRRYVSGEAWQQMLSADEWLELMLSKIFFTRDELQDEYEQRKQHDNEALCEHDADEVPCDLLDISML